MIHVLAQEAADSASIDAWVLVGVSILIAVLTIGGSLGGVFLGSRLDRDARREERRDAERTELRKDASDVLGQARVVLTAMQPNQYAAFARAELFDEIDKRRREADSIRPRLAALAVRWSEAALELNAVERHLGLTPSRLEMLVKAVIDHDPFTEMLSEREAEHDATVSALDRAIDRLASEGGPYKESKNPGH